MCDKRSLVGDVMTVTHVATMELSLMTHALKRHLPIICHFNPENLGNSIGLDRSEPITKGHRALLNRNGRRCQTTLISTETHVPSPWYGQYRTHAHNHITRTVAAIPMPIAVGELFCGSQPTATTCLRWSWRLKECYALASASEGRDARV